MQRRVARHQRDQAIDVEPVAEHAVDAVGAVPHPPGATVERAADPGLEPVEVDVGHRLAARPAAAERRQRGLDAVVDLGPGCAKFSSPTGARATIAHPAQVSRPPRFLRIEPRARGLGFEFVNDVFGGAIPHQFIGSVEKGVLDALEIGPLSGSPVQDLRVVVTDGKAHSVDSKDIAFRTAAKFAFRDAFARARPILLEPIVNLEITVPEAHVGAVTTDLKNMRGRVLGFDTLAGNVTVVDAQAPLAEVGNYVGQLRGNTSGQGSFAMELSHYDVAPQPVQQKVTAAYKPHPEE